MIIPTNDLKNNDFPTIYNSSFFVKTIKVSLIASNNLYKQSNIMITFFSKNTF